MNRLERLGQDRRRSFDAALDEAVNRLGEGLGRSERRTWPRRSAHLDIWLTLESSSTVVRARTTNISSGGFYTTLACDVGVDKDQTVQVRITELPSDRLTGAKALVNCPARLTRRELLLGENESLVGLAFEFERPQSVESEPYPVGMYNPSF